MPGTSRGKQHAEEDTCIRGKERSAFGAGVGPQKMVVKGRSEQICIEGCIDVRGGGNRPESIKPKEREKSKKATVDTEPKSCDNRRKLGVCGKRKEGKKVAQITKLETARSLLLVTNARGWLGKSVNRFGGKKRQTRAGFLARERKGSSHSCSAVYFDVEAPSTESVMGVWKRRPGSTLATLNGRKEKTRKNAEIDLLQLAAAQRT